MSFTSNLAQSSGPTGDQLVTSKDYQGTHKETLDIQVADGATDVEIPIAFAVASVEVFHLHSDQALTIKTNDSGTPVDTFSPKQNVAYVFTKDGYDTFKFTTDVTKIFVTNASGNAARLQIKLLSA